MRSMRARNRCLSAGLDLSSRAAINGPEDEVSNGVLAVAVVLAAVAMVVILGSTVAVLLLRRTMHAQMAASGYATSSMGSSTVGAAFILGPTSQGASMLPRMQHWRRSHRHAHACMHAASAAAAMA
jgi:uncharacterized protein YybS (DUF2232 family)